MKKTLFLLFGIFCYAFFFGTYCYAIGFVTNLVVPMGLDSKPVSSVGFSLLINTGLLLLFAVQHSIMARPAFKQWWTKIIPVPIERSVYVLLSSLCLIALFYFCFISGNRWEELFGQYNPMLDLYC